MASHGSSFQKAFIGGAGTSASTELNVEDVFATSLWTGNGGGLYINNGLRLGARGGGSSVRFDGVDDRLSRTSELTNAADGKTFTLSAFVYPERKAGNNFFEIATSGGSGRFQLSVDDTGKLIVKALGTDGSNVLTLESRLNPSSGSPGGIVLGNWQHILVSVDMSDTNKRHLYIDDAIPSHVDFDSYVNADIDFTNPKQGIAGSPTAVAGAQRLSNLYLDFTYRDLSTESNRRLFVNANLEPVAPPSNSIIHMKLDGTDANTGVNSGTGGNFTVNGSPTVLDTLGPFQNADGAAGGLVWIKNRSAAVNHILVDTERGAKKFIQSDTSAAEVSGNAFTSNQSVMEFSASGFRVGNYSKVNVNNGAFCSWTFRKQAKFFDIVTWTGNGSHPRNISHNLGSIPGAIFIKNLSDGGDDWKVYHRGIANDAETDHVNLNLADAAVDNDGPFNDTAPTASVFTVGDNSTNQNSQNFVAYLFAHHATNATDTGFGSDGGPVISCGNYTGNNSSQDIDVGFEPQFVIFKGTSEGSSQWNMVDTIRGLSVDQVIDKVIYANDDGAESSEDGNIGAEAFGVTNTGFSVAGEEVLHNKNGNNYIYMAVRRPMGAPTKDLTGVPISPFSAVTTGTPDDDVITAFPFRPEYTDMVWFVKRGGDAANIQIATRLTGFQSTTTNSDDGYVTPTLSTQSTAAEDNTSTAIHQTETQVDYPIGPILRAVSSGSNFLMYRWRRMKGYFDVCAYTGTGSARTISHQLGVAPEMTWIKGRDSADNWSVFHKDLTAGDHLQLNDSATVGTNSNMFTTTAPTASVFSVGSDGAVNGSGSKYIAYLFSTLAGVSKVGSFTGNGNNGRVIDCGFSAGASFIFIKGATNTENYLVFDSVRGIVAGNDPKLQMDNSSAEFTNADLVDPDNSGFIVNNASEVNGDGVTYVFYAIAA